MKTYPSFRTKILGVIVPLSFAAFAACGVDPTESFDSQNQEMAQTQQTPHTRQIQRCEQACSQHLPSGYGQKQAKTCRQSFQVCKKTKNRGQCMQELTDCVGKAIEQRDEHNQEYNQCMESCHAAPMPHKRKGFKESKGCHGGFLCFHKCRPNAVHCQKGCRRERRSCLQLAYEMYLEWIGSLQDQLEFCEAMFPDDPEDQEICIQGVITGVEQPQVTFKSCWIDSFSCSQNCLIELITCVGEC